MTGENSMDRIILASASPRRQELLKQIGLIFEVIPSAIEENIDPNLSPEAVVQEFAHSKAADVADRLAESSVVIGADTIVVHRGRILGKPKDDDEAYKMLKLLEGDEHDVITGYTVIRTGDGKRITGFEKTLVKFRSLADHEIRSYVATREPRDKAGAYGIQGVGCLLVEKIEGDYFNIVGLPLGKLGAILSREFNIEIL
jgi:septum formation protein